MKVGGQIAIASVATLGVVGLLVIFTKKASASTTATNGSSALGNKKTNTPPAPPPPRLGDAASLANNYVVYTLYIVKQLQDSGNVTQAHDLLAQLSNAWGNSPDGVPMYNNSTVLQIHGTLPNGAFDSPSVFGTVYGSQNDKVKAVYGNALMLISLAAKNNIQANTHGQAIGARQKIVVDAYINAQKVIDNINLVPQYGLELVTIYGYSLTANSWPSGFGGGTPDNSDLKKIFALIIPVATTVAKAVI